MVFISNVIPFYFFGFVSQSERLALQFNPIEYVILNATCIMPNVLSERMEPLIVSRFGVVAICRGD